MKKIVLISLFALTTMFMSGCAMNVTCTCPSCGQPPPKKEMKADHRKQRGRTPQQKLNTPPPPPPQAKK